MDQKQLQYIAIGTLGAILLVLVIGYFMGWFVDGQLALVPGEGDTGNTSTYSAIARNAKASLTGTNVRADYMVSVGQQLLVLNNNELRTVHNMYLRKYATPDAPTLKLLVQGELTGSLIWGGVCSDSDKNTLYSPCWYQQSVVDKLNYINA